MIQAAENAEQVTLANALMANGHQPGHRAALRWIETCGAGTPEASPRHTRIALWNGSLAGALRVTTGTVRIGGARLRMGGLGWLTTSSRHRHKGIGRALLSDTLGYLRGQNYHVSMLFGIPNFYRRFGFETVLREYAWEFGADSALPETAGYRIRNGKPGDIRSVRAIHERNDGDLSCSLVRSAAHITNRWEQWKSLQVVTDAQGRVLGYFLPGESEESCEIIEAGAENHQACAYILSTCAGIARRNMLGKVRFLGPAAHGFGSMAGEVLGAESLQHIQDAGGMMSFVNLDEALESMIPEWESRLLGTSLAGADTELCFVLRERSYRLHAHRGAIDISPGTGKNKVGLGEGALLSLLTGYDDGAHFLERARRMLSPAARALFSALFPARSPYVWRLDRF